MRVALMAVSLAACSSGKHAGNSVACGPGTVSIDNECRPIDAGEVDAAIDDAPDAPIDAPPDAGPVGTAATSFGLDPAHDNAQPSDAVKSPLAPLWTMTFGGPVSYPLVVNEVVFVSIAEPQPSVSALDIKTGAQLWGPIALAAGASLAYDDHRVFALDRNGKLTALDAGTGAQQWTIQVTGEAFYRSPPVAFGGLIYVNGTGSNGVTVAIDEQTGAVRWRKATYGTDGCVAVADGVVYESEPTDWLSAWDAITGTILWSRAGNGIGGGGAAPSVYMTKIWVRDPVFGGDLVAHDGALLGTFASTAAPALHAGLAFYPSGSTVTAVDIATDTIRWTFAGDGQLCTSPVVAGAGHQVFIGSRTGRVYELDEMTGTQRSVHDVGAAVTCFSESNSMTLADDHLLVPAGTELVVY
jgi:outer membrane protein assembly factor BamB